MRLRTTPLTDLARTPALVGGHELFAFVVQEGTEQSDLLVEGRGAPPDSLTVIAMFPAAIQDLNRIAVGMIPLGCTCCAERGPFNQPRLGRPTGEGILDEAFCLTRLLRLVRCELLDVAGRL